MSTLQPPGPRPLCRTAAPPAILALDAARRACLRAAHALGRAARGLRARARRAQDRALLLAMSARELNDLGLGRGEIERLTGPIAPAPRAD
jgi:uncharacterized protein YjiS (DUF1127 family)